LNEETKGSKLDQFLHAMKMKGIDIGMFAATWVTESTNLKIGEHDELLYLHHNQHNSKKSKNRKAGSKDERVQCVGLVLSADAQTAFCEAGSQKLTFGCHILAVPLHVLDSKGRRLRLFVAAAHAPDFKHKQAEKDEYAKNLGKCLDACGPNEILVMGTSCHGRLGVSGDVRGSDEVGSNSYSSVLGKWGLEKRDSHGQNLLDVLPTCTHIFFPTQNVQYVHTSSLANATPTRPLANEERYTRGWEFHECALASFAHSADRDNASYSQSQARRSKRFRTARSDNRYICT